MKTYKSIAYAFATSPAAKELGFADTGCFYVQQRYSDIEGSGQDSVPFAAHNGEGYLKANNPDLIAFYKETDGEPCPMFLRHGNQDALNALKS